jgi:hypothetical protein
MERLAWPAERMALRRPWVHYTGENDRARPHFFERVMPRVYELLQSRQIRVFASMVTRLDLLPQLDMVPAAQFEGMAGAPMWHLL